MKNNKFRKITKPFAILFVGIMSLSTVANAAQNQLMQEQEDEEVAPYYGCALISAAVCVVIVQGDNRVEEIGYAY